MPLVPLFSTAVATGATEGPLLLSVYMKMQPSMVAAVLTHFFDGTEGWLKKSRSLPFMNSVNGEQPTPGFPGTFW